jgi:alanine racemase
MQTSRCWAEISRKALVHNARVAQERIGSAELLAVVKANAYGHGMLGVAEALRNQAKIFGVANLEEAVALRQKLDHPVMILGPALPDERRLIIERGFIPSISTLEEAREFNRLAKDRSAPICFVIDTGMGRMGTPATDAVETAAKIAALPNLKLHSVSSHLPVADEDQRFTRDELKLFSEMVERLRTEIPGDWKAHILLSAGILACPDLSFDLVRAGLMLYGISPLPEMQSLLRPVMTWKTRIGIVRELPRGSSVSYGRTFVAPRSMKVATLTAGYADGYPRHLSNRGTAVLISGQRCALLGRMTMDLMVVDVSELSAAQPGDEAVLMGVQEGEEISCAELAQKAETITWEIIARVGQRVPRVLAD